MQWKNERKRKRERERGEGNGGKEQLNRSYSQFSYTKSFEQSLNNYVTVKEKKIQSFETVNGLSNLDATRASAMLIFILYSERNPRDRVRHTQREKEREKAKLEARCTAKRTSLFRVPAFV